MRPSSTLLAFAALAVFVATPAHAQMRVDARIQMSSGSCAGCDLSNKSMNGVRFNNANLSGSLFNNSNLSGGHFDGSDLSGAHFRKALMYRVEGEGVKLPRAMMTDATLTEANFPNANVSQVDFSRADLSRATFTDSDFRRARLDNANLSGANLIGGQFQDASLPGTILTDANLSLADFSGADLSTSQGLKQAQLDVACGDMNTRLPVGLTLRYCDGAPMQHVAGNHGTMSDRMQAAVGRIDRAITDVEALLADTPEADTNMRRSLERIHADLVQSHQTLQR